MSYYLKRKKYKLIFFLLLLILLLAVLGTTTVGIANISTDRVLGIIFTRIFAKIPGLAGLIGETNINLEDTSAIIVWQLRLPRVILAALVGALLASVGACFQGLFRNPMADPYVLGISNGAGAGATVAIVLGLGGMARGAAWVSFLAFGGAMVTTLAVYAIANVRGRLPIINLLLAGIAVGFFASALVTILMVLNKESTERIIKWLMGSVSAADWEQVALVAPVTIAGWFVLYLFARDLNACQAGEETALSLGVKVESVKKLLLGVCALLIAVCVSVSGIIGFVGLVVPHAARILVGPDQRGLLPFSAVGGALFLIVCDTLARSLIPPMELPVGAVTSLFGAPYFCLLLIKAKKKVS